MLQETMDDDPTTPDSVQDDPLLKPGAFIDPTPAPTSNGHSRKGGKRDKSRTPPPPPPQQNSDQKSGSAAAGPMDVTDPANRPDWLPSGWLFRETLRTSGASAGSKDKYFIDPATNRRFRSRKEVFQYLETGTTPKKRRNADSDADSSPLTITDAPSKRKRSEGKVKTSVKHFNFDEVPDKVKWDLIDDIEGTWRPLINGTERVPESSKQEWTAAFTYLTLQNAA